MLILERLIGRPMRSRLCYWRISAIGFLFVAAVLSLLVFVATSFIQIDADHKPISSALFFSHGAIDRTAAISDHRIAPLSSFGSQIAQRLT